MTPLGPHLAVFLREYLPSQRKMSVQTSDTYAYVFQLLVCFAAERLKTTPSALTIEQLDPTLVLAFLEHLEKERGNCARTRNSRLAAIKTFFRFLEYRFPSCLDQAHRIRAVPVKKTNEVIIGYLNREEIQALLDGPDASSRDGLRDRAMLHLAFAGGLRVSELIGLNLANLVLHPQATVHVMGKGRRERVLSLWKETATTLRDWLKVRGEPKSTALFLNARGDVMTRLGFEYILEKHVRTASATQPSLAQKHVSPHSLRHSCAMHTLHATGDIRKVALWLGHASLQSTEVYLRADPTESWKPWHHWFRRPCVAVTSGHRTSYSPCFGPNNSPRYAPSRASQRAGFVSRRDPTPHNNGRRIFPAVDGVYRNQDAQLRRDLNQEADSHNSRLSIAKYEAEAPFNWIRSLPGSLPVR